MKSADEFLPFITRFGPAVYPSQTYFEQAQALVAISAGLTDTQKMIAEYWANGPHTELPPGHWDLFAQFVSARDHHSVDDDVKMFFALTAAIHDAGIAAWDAKRKFDSVRPATAIPYLFHGQTLAACSLCAVLGVLFAREFSASHIACVQFGVLFPLLGQIV